MPAWQPPIEGLTPEEKDEFWRRVNVQGEHWFWTGSDVGGTPVMEFRGQSISACRISWAVMYPDTLVPGALMPNKKKCEHKRLCLNPEHKMVSTVLRKRGDDDDSGIQIPRALEAMAHLQFGTPVTPRTLRKLVVTTHEKLNTPEGRITVAPPSGITTYTPNAYDLENAPELTADLLLDLLFQPDTVVMTFKSGTTWISSPQGRVSADDPKAALLGLLIRSGRHSVRG